MKQESLTAVLHLRRLLVDDAARDLAGCIQAETAATEAVRTQAGEISRQRQAAEGADASDTDVETFGAWFRRARARLDELVATQERAALRTMRARTELSVARTALETAEILQAAASNAAAADARRNEQKAIDEAASHVGHAGPAGQKTAGLPDSNDR